MKPSEILLEMKLCKNELARAKNGYTVEATKDSVVSVCVVGAICRSLGLGSVDSFDDKLRNIVETVADQLPSGVKKEFEKRSKWTTLVAWNNRPSSRKSEVIALLRKAGY